MKVSHWLCIIMYIAIQVVAIKYNAHTNTHTYNYSICLHTEKIFEETLIVFVAMLQALKHNLF